VAGYAEAAIAALRDRRYEPGRDGDGNAVEVQIVEVVPFRSTIGK